MKSENVAGFTLYYPTGEEETAGLIRAACEKSVNLIQTRWGLAAPPDCRVYVMTSWRQFLFHSAPWYLKPYLVAVYPFLALKAASIWRYAGGWAIRYGRRQVVGIKPARLLKISDRRYAEHLLIEDRTEEERIQTVACHELTHAFTAHLKLPAWLREGLATLAMEHYLGRRIVSRESLEALSQRREVLAAGPLQAYAREATNAYRVGGSAGGWVERFGDDYLLSCKAAAEPSVLLAGLRSWAQANGVPVARVFVRDLPLQRRDPRSRALVFRSDFGRRRSGASEREVRDGGRDRDGDERDHPAGGSGGARSR